MKHDERVYLQHILDAIARIDEYLTGIDEDNFHQIHLVQDGVIRQLEIIGEATKQVSPETRSQYPQIPWQDVAGMRDKLIHHYFGVDLNTVWLTVKEDLPSLKETVSQILTDNSK